MAGGSRYTRVMFGEVQDAAQAAGEHRLALHRERQSARMSRSRLSQEARQHHRVLAEIREGASRDRRLHRSALRENPWIMAWAEKILAHTNKKG